MLGGVRLRNRAACLSRLCTRGFARRHAVGARLWTRIHQIRPEFARALGVLVVLILATEPPARGITPCRVARGHQNHYYSISAQHATTARLLSERIV